MQIIISLLVSSPLFGIIIYWLFFPEKAEIASAQVYKIFRFFFKKAEKHYITHDTQGRVNDFVNNYLSKNIKDFAPKNIKLTWVDAETAKEEAFEHEGELIVRMKMSVNKNKNFVNATMVFIAESLLSRVKRYISVRQRESIDLFVGRKIFEAQGKEEIVRQFIDDYLSKKMADEKINKLIEKYHYIDLVGLFYPVLVQELNFLGDKIFSSVPTQTIYQEVHGLLDFLTNYSTRKPGEESQDFYDGGYCKFGIMIVGMSQKIAKQGEAPYVNHLSKLRTANVQTIYAIGDIRNKEFIQSVCSAMVNDYEVYHEQTYKAKILNSRAIRVDKSNFLIVLRHKKIQHYFAKEDYGTTS